MNEEEEMAAAEEHLRPRVIGLPPDEWYRERAERQREREAAEREEGNGGQGQGLVSLEEGGRLPGYGEAILAR